MRSLRRRVRPRRRPRAGRTQDGHAPQQFHGREPQEELRGQEQQEEEEEEEEEDEDEEEEEEEVNRIWSI